MTLSDRLVKINANRMRLQARIQRKSLRHESISYDQAKLIRETVKAIKAEMKLEKESMLIRFKHTARKAY